MTWTPCNCCDAFWCTAHKKHTHDCACPPAEEWTTDPYVASKRRRSGSGAALYFVLDQASEGGVDLFYVAGECGVDEGDGGEGTVVHYWTEDVLLAALFTTAEDAARAVVDIGDPGLLVAALPESFAAFVVERHNYAETLDRVEKQASDFIRQSNAFARAIAQERP